MFWFSSFLYAMMGDTMLTTTDKAVFHYRKAVPALSFRAADNNVVKPQQVAAFLQNAERLGFVFTPEVINTFWGNDAARFLEWATDILAFLRTTKNAHFRYTPMYPNFPQQVAEASDAELYLNAVAHYFGTQVGLRALPEYEKVERFPLWENTDLVKVSLVTSSTVEEVLRNLLGAKISFSETDRENLASLVDDFEEDQVLQLIPEVIPNKENLATAAGVFRSSERIFAALLGRAATATDVLRIAAVMSGGHPTLTDAFRFGKFSRPERRAFLAAIDAFSVESLDEDFHRNPGLWKQFGEKLHPAEPQNVERFPFAALAFEHLRDNVRVDTFNSQVEYAIGTGDVDASVRLLSTRPGEFARRLNQLLSGTPFERHDFIIDGFLAVAHKVSTPVLLQVLNYFGDRVDTTVKNGVRLFFPKGTTGFAYVREDTREELPYQQVFKLYSGVTKVLEGLYAEKTPLGKVFIPEGAHAVPFGLRSASKAFTTLGRGSRIPFDGDKTLRFFMHWFDAPYDRVDLDLSAVLLDENFAQVGSITYYNLREFGGVHSGDITSAPRGASEFIDINPKMAAKNGRARYVVMTVHSFTGEMFNTLNTAVAGFMTRKSANSGEVFEPATIGNTFNVQSAARITAPLIFDVQENVAYWADLALTNNMLAGGNVRNTASLNNLVRGVVERTFLSIEELFQLHVSARGGKIVKTAEEADTVLGYVGGELTIGMDELLSDWM
jgi:hypothetical protein